MLFIFKLFSILISFICLLSVLNMNMCKYDGIAGDGVLEEHGW